MNSTEVYHSKKVWNCDCDGPHYLKVSRHCYPDGDGLDQWIILQSYSSSPSFWWRIRECWKLLRENTHEAEWCEVYLDDRTAREIAQALTEAADYYEQWEGKKGEWQHGLSDVKDEPFWHWGWNRTSWWLRRHWDGLHPLVMVGVGILLYHLARTYWLR